MTLLLIVLLGLLFGGGLAQAQSAAPSLFSDADIAGADIVYTPPAEVARYRYVNVELGQLPGKLDAAGAAPELTLNLFPDARFTGVVKKVQTTPGMGTSWIGTLAGKTRSYFYLVVADDVFIAHVASTEGVYEVSWAGDSVYRVVQLDHSKFGEDYPIELPQGAMPPLDIQGTAADTASTIDIMVMYTDDARAAEGSTAAMKARIALAVTETNQSYSNSGVTPRLRLVHVEEVSYAETGNLNTDLTRFRGTSDGYMDIVHSRRNTYGADMVALIVENGGPYCGLASAIMASATTAFQVTDRGCATGYYSFGHEFGHLQGARHDTYVDSSTTPYSYGHGYVHRHASTPSQRWRTVMAYDDYCQVVGYSCTRLQWWSNPAKTYLGAAMGNSAAKNYQVLNTTAYTVANFRQQTISNNFNSTFNSNASGWSAVKGSWTRVSPGYYRSSGLPSASSSAKRSGTYGDLTYEVRLKRTGTCASCTNRIILRGKPTSLVTDFWKPSYMFQYSNSGDFSVWEVTSGGSSAALKSWTASSAIVKNGWNTLKVVAVGTSLKFYINNVLVWSGSDTSLLTGQVGVGFYRDAAAGTLDVDWAKLSTTPTADVNPAADIAPGVEREGGTVDVAP